MEPVRTRPDRSLEHLGVGVLAMAVGATGAAARHHIRAALWPVGVMYTLVAQAN